MFRTKTCIQCACASIVWDSPHHLDRGCPSQTDLDRATDLPEDVKQVLAIKADVTEGHITFQLNPPGLQEEKLFDHMVTYRRQMVTHNIHNISIHLHVASPHNETQESLLLRKSQADLCLGKVMRDVGASGAHKKTATQKLHVHIHSTHRNHVSQTTRNNWRCPHHYKKIRGKKETIIGEARSEGRGRQQTDKERDCRYLFYSVWQRDTTTD